MKVRMRFRHAIMLALGATYLCGCLPVPWFYHTRPDIDGTVRRTGVPIEGAKVVYSENLSDVDCTSSNDSYPQSAISSADGSFHFDGTYSFFHIVFLLPGTAEFAAGRICFDTSDGQRFKQRVDMRGGTVVGSIPNESWDLLTIDCDLANDTCTGSASK